MGFSLKEFCNSYDELHAIVVGIFWPIFLWPFLLKRPSDPEDEFLSLVRKEPHYIGIGLATQLILLLGATYFIIKRTPRQRGGV